MQASGEVLLFLHADARLLSRARAAILDAIQERGVIGGSFFIRYLPQS